MMHTRIGIAFVVAMLAASPAAAEPYRIAYEGNDFPENEGWLRVTTGGGAERSINDGILTLDGLADIAISDAYRWRQPGAIDPGAGEVFFATWRLAVDEVVRREDPTVGIFSDLGRVVGLTFSDTGIVSVFEDVTIDYSLSGFHEFELVSDDMAAYELRIDGEIVHTGSFSQVSRGSEVVWGDGVSGVSSKTRWDYFRFGVMPEPSTGWLIVVPVFLLQSRRGGHT